MTHLPWGILDMFRTWAEISIHHDAAFQLAIHHPPWPRSEFQSTNWFVPMLGFFRELAGNREFGRCLPRPCEGTCALRLLPVWVPSPCSVKVRVPFILVSCCHLSVVEGLRGTGSRRLLVRGGG
jgi:hypothetical protein